MFGFFNKKQQELPSAEELERLTAAATEEVKAKWIYFNKTVNFKENVPLSVKIAAFAQPIQEFLQNNYPMLIIVPTNFWSIVSISIHESGTHSKESVNAALETVFKENLGRAP